MTATDKSQTAASLQTASCAFCQKTKEQVRRMISGPSVHICDVCVEICHEMLETPAMTPAEMYVREQEQAQLMQMADVSLSLLMLRATHLGATLDFYRRLGLLFVEEQHGNDPVHYSSSLAGTVLELYPEAAEAQPDNKVRIGFNVPSIEETLRTLEETGVKVLSPPKQTQWGYRAVVFDPDERTIEITETKNSLTESC
jgi:predicted enzyme related to lactoylglutathione lyase